MVTTPDPGLDLAALRGLRAPSAKSSVAAVADITARIGAHLAAHDGYVAFSGGKDSLFVLDLARRIEDDMPVVFFDSGLDSPKPTTTSPNSRTGGGWTCTAFPPTHYYCRCTPTPGSGTTPPPLIPRPRGWICRRC
ncbi:phosphoadenosine phosphosulfate reductase family protein [Streptomyces sp. NPDC058171]